MKYVGMTFKAYGDSGLVKVYECEKCGLRQRGKGKCSECERRKAIRAHHEEEFQAGIL